MNEGNRDESCFVWVDLTHHSSLKSLRNAECYSAQKDRLVEHDK